MKQSSAYHDSPFLWKAPLEQGLKEDQAQFDWTAIATSSSTSLSHARVVAKESGIVVLEGACQAAQAIAAEFGWSIDFKSARKNGDGVNAGETVLSISGPARGIVALERPFLNLVSFASGIATRTRAFARKVEAAGLKRPPRLCPIRKTLPFYRDLSIFATLVGGAHPHRLGLSGGVLIKENHVVAAGGVTRAVQCAKQVASHALKIEIEVRDLDELQEAIEASADVVMLDNFKLEWIPKAVALARGSARAPVLEVSGGITLENIEGYLIDGVDVISIGSLTHSVKVLDLSLLFEGA